MEYRHLQLGIASRIATLRLDRPPGNSLNIDMIDEMNQALLELRGRRGVDVLVLRGSGGLFCAGLDLDDHVKDRVQRLVQVYSRFFETIRMMDVIAVAAVEGRAWGAGFELCLGCNLIVAADDATFALPDIRHGIIPMIASIILPRATPRRKAMEWILTGKQIPAAQLEHYGLVNALLAPDRFDEELRAFLQDLTRTSGPVLQLAKRAQSEAYYSTYEEALYKVQNMYLRDVV
jgi:enoyl-CoA hydratase